MRIELNAKGGGPIVVYMQAATDPAPVAQTPTHTQDREADEHAVQLKSKFPFARVWHETHKVVEAIETDPPIRVGAGETLQFVVTVDDPSAVDILDPLVSMVVLKPDAQFTVGLERKT